ncbi:hypothetical protein F443_10136 [Phytophthora nicotianae P1569]|uniref:Uncharacterized protein n=2 Tax=Phytophthora nicotianae TaxID=4792 RepID=V9F2B0_PHYNI|nr:hypothetical protein F443_10136 [Phytophthora nicotianae P1569]ETO73895.1 hypothetical protein F444_10232 [Phytophthora nicotianae P1976]
MVPRAEQRAASGDNNQGPMDSDGEQDGDRR